MKPYFVYALSTLLLLASTSFAARNGATAGMSEDNFMTSNGQGISSPSFWNGIEGENPAGLVFNQSVKLQIGAGSYSGTNYTYGSGGVLAGNGMIAAGLEYQNYTNYFGSGSSQGKVNWGLAGRLQTILTTFGLSSHMTLNGGGNTYDAGLMIEPTRRLRFGFMIPDVGGKIDNFAGGLTFLLDDSVEMVVDADYNSTSPRGIVKPGISFHTERVQATVAYGLRYKGTSNVLLYQGFGAGLGIKLAESLLISYEYRGIPDHRLGLTLRFN